MHQVDEIGILADIDPEESLSPQKTAIQKRKQQAQSEREKKRNEFEVEFSNLELEGITVSAEELAKKLGTNSRELLSWLGNGNRQKKILKDGFEKYM